MFEHQTCKIAMQTLEKMDEIKYLKFNIIKIYIKSKELKAVNGRN